MTWKKIEIYCWCSFSALYYVSSKEKKKKQEVSDGQTFIFCKGYSALWWHS